MYDTPRTIEQILTMLAGAPARIAGLTAGLTPAQWVANHELSHFKQVERIASAVRR